MNFPMKFQTAVETIISLYAVPPPTRTRNHGQRDATRRFSLRQLLNPRRYAILLSEQRDGRRAKEEEEKREKERRERKIEGWIAGTGLWGWFRGMDTGLHGHGNGYSTIACNPISTDAIYPIYHTLLSGALSTPVPRPLDRLTLVLIEFAQRWPRSCAPLFARVRQCFSWLASTTRRDVRAPCARFALIRISRLWWRSVRARSTPPMDKRARPSQRNRKGFR